MLANPSTPGITGLLATACGGAACTSAAQLLAVPKLAFQVNTDWEFQLGGGELSFKRLRAPLQPPPPRPP